MKWSPTKIWKDKDCFIIGGGTSLKDFNWSLLKQERTIGCNKAFELGSEICDVCFFADIKFYNAYKEKLAEFKNPIITNCDKLFNSKEPWLKWIPRVSSGLCEDKLGYNLNSGASAINLAILFGATTIYLLGFDMQLGEDGNSNWHPNELDKPDPAVYVRMLRNFKYVVRDLNNKFSNHKIFNINKNSKLNLFPVIDPDIFWAERKLKCTC